VVVQFHWNRDHIRSTISRMEGVCRLGDKRLVLMWGVFCRPTNLHFQRNSGVFQSELCQKCVENEALVVPNAPLMFVARA
jgi:hypothetical protein